MARDAPPDPLIGDTIKGRYRLVQQLGVEATGTAYLAETVDSRQLATIRLLPGVFAEDDPFTWRFLRQVPEAIERSLSDSTFVALLEAGRTADGRLFAAFEHLGPRRLSDVLREESPLELPRALRLAIQIGQGFETAQNLGCLDLPIGPARIAIVGNEAVKLLGSEVVALRTLGVLDRLGPEPADPGSVAPEQRDGQPATDRAAVYVFGAAVHQILTGVSPPADPTARPRSLRMARPGISRRLDRVVSPALDPQPARRPASVTTMLNQLAAELVLLDEPSVGPRRWALVWGVTGVVTLLVLAGLWFLPARGGPSGKASRGAAEPVKATQPVPRPVPTLAQDEPAVAPAATGSVGVPAESPLTTAGLPQAAAPARPATLLPRAAPRTLEQALPPAPRRDDAPPTVSTAPAPPPRVAPRPEPARREPDDPDPSAVIDWLLGKD